VAAGHAELYADLVSNLTGTHAGGGEDEDEDDEIEDSLNAVRVL
jgi:hypothetical protein